jgi:hypothetical protein
MRNNPLRVGYVREVAETDGDFVLSRRKRSGKKKRRRDAETKQTLSEV